MNDTPESRCLLIHLHMRQVEGMIISDTVWGGRERERERERERDSVSYCLTGSIHASSTLCIISTFTKLVRTH